MNLCLDYVSRFYHIFCDVAYVSLGSQLFEKEYQYRRLKITLCQRKNCF